MLSLLSCWKKISIDTTLSLQVFQTSSWLHDNLSIQNTDKEILANTNNQSPTLNNHPPLWLFAFWLLPRQLPLSWDLLVFHVLLWLPFLSSFLLLLLSLQINFGWILQFGRLFHCCLFGRCLGFCGFLGYFGFGWCLGLGWFLGCFGFGRVIGFGWLLGCFI